MHQKTVAIIKPDGHLMGYSGLIQDRYENAGLKVEDVRNLFLSRPAAEELYRQHKGTPFFTGLCLAMSCSSPIVVFLLSGEDAVATVRKLNGSTDPRKAEPGTIRHDFMSAGGPFNTVHGSDSEEEARREWLIVLQAEYDDACKHLPGPHGSRPTEPGW